jgi:hypothetical protein
MVCSVCANATFVRGGALWGVQVCSDSNMRRTAEIRPASVQTHARTVDAETAGCARSVNTALRRHDRSVDRRDLSRTRTDRSSHRPVPAPLQHGKSAIEDISSSMQPEGTHHERPPASPLQLHHVSRYGLHLRVPASRPAGRRRLRPAMPMRPDMPVRRAVPMRRRRQLRPILNGFHPTRRRWPHLPAAGTLTSRVGPAPRPHEGTCS